MDIDLIYNIIIAASPALTAIIGIIFGILKVVSCVKSSSADYNKTIKDMQDMLMQSRKDTRELEIRLERLTDEMAASRRGPDLNSTLDKED